MPRTKYLPSKHRQSVKLKMKRLRTTEKKDLDGTTHASQVEPVIQDKSEGNRHTVVLPIKQLSSVEDFAVPSTSTAILYPDPGTNVISYEESQPEQDSTLPFSNPTVTHQEYDAENIELEDTTSSFDIEGRRIIDIQYFFKQILNEETHAPFGCSIINVEVIAEKRNGLYSNFKLKCKVCNVIQTICSEDIADNLKLNVNVAAVVASISTGIGFSNLEETHAALSLPTMSNKLYLECHDMISTSLSNSALKVMEEAGKEEANLARELGEVDENGIPLITVIADGAWSKRSYGPNYLASSGVGGIIGARTHKLLFLGIRHKYCFVCARADKTKTLDVCFKNFGGTSTSMEADIIVDRFKRSIEHGLIYEKLVGDGDSSVTKQLLMTKPYENRLVQKYNAKTIYYVISARSFAKYVKKTRSTSLNLQIPSSLRTVLKSRILRLRISIEKAIEFIRSEDNQN